MCGLWELEQRWGGLEDFEEDYTDDFDYYLECVNQGNTNHKAKTTPSHSIQHDLVIIVMPMTQAERNVNAHRSKASSKGPNKEPFSCLGRRFQKDIFLKPPPNVSTPKKSKIPNQRRGYRPCIYDTIRILGRKRTSSSRTQQDGTRI